MGSLGPWGLGYSFLLMKLPRFEKGKVITAEDLNALAHAIERSWIKPGVGYLVREGSGGTVLQILGGRGPSSPPKRGRFTVTNAGNSEVKIAEGLVYEQNPDAKNGGSAAPTLIHWPTVGGTAINADPAPVLSVADGDFIYLKLATDEAGLITACTIEAQASAQVTVPHEPTPPSGSGQTGTYYFELAQVTVDSGKVTVDQALESDVVWQPERKAIFGVTDSVGPPAWNTALAPGTSGIEVTDQDGKAEIVPLGSTGSVAFQYCGASSPFFAMEVVNGMIHSMTSTQAVHDKIEVCTTAP